MSIRVAAKDSDLTRYATFRTPQAQGHQLWTAAAAILDRALQYGRTWACTPVIPFWWKNAEASGWKLTPTDTAVTIPLAVLLPRALSLRARQISRGTRSTADSPAPMSPGITPCAPTSWIATMSAKISFTEDTTELFDNLIVSLGYVVVLIIICAAALAAVVLGNLISVNLGERKVSWRPSRCWLLRSGSVPLHLPRDRSRWRLLALAWVWHWWCRPRSSC